MYFIHTANHLTFHFLVHKKIIYCVSLHLRLYFSQLSLFLWLPTCCDLTFSHLCLFLLASYSIFGSSPQLSAFNFLQRYLIKPILFLPKTLILLVLTFVIGRSNRFGFQVSEWRQCSHEIRSDIYSVYINLCLVSNNTDEISSSSVFFLSHPIVFRLLKKGVFHKYSLHLLLPVALDDNRSRKCKVSQFSTSCRLAELGATAVTTEIKKREKHI